eukprot:TRINITY_DN35208_c0_g1_i1.p2 TRINITY_DN35208_c0_g1~~TRINITY_DN35208_c0_g1_i1.p2  ORF type:complete len:112 (-),score=1.21 TRINITY_DN35208_c0_g1_i1:46-381(-)
MSKACIIFFFQAEDGIRDAQESRGLGDVYKRQPYMSVIACVCKLEEIEVISSEYPERRLHPRRWPTEYGTNDRYTGIETGVTISILVLLGAYETKLRDHWCKNRLGWQLLG